MSLYKRRLTQLDGKMGPALRVAYTDVGEERKLGRGSFASEKEPLSVARCSFGTTKPRTSRLDWHFFSGNINNLISANRP